MPGGDIRRAELVRIVDQRAELDPRVADHAGVGRARAAESVRKVGAHLPLERLAPVRDVKRDAELVRGALRFRLAAQAHFEEQAVHVKALRAQARRRHRGIHPAGQPQNDFFCHSCKIS